jgi:predicted transcriptional regulator
MSNDTSAEALQSIQPIIGTIRQSVLQAISVKGLYGSTCEEVEIELNMRHQTASSACNYLQEKGLIIDSGARRRTTSGRKARVYVAKERDHRG